jgi:hypothetical protein
MVIIILGIQFKVVYKPSWSHCVIDALSQFSNVAKSIGVFIKQLMVHCLFYNVMVIKCIWLFEYRTNVNQLCCNLMSKFRFINLFAF